MKPVFRLFFLFVFGLSFSTPVQAQVIKLSWAEGQQRPKVTYENAKTGLTTDARARQLADACNLRTHATFRATQFCAGTGTIYPTIMSWADLGSNCEGTLIFELSDGTGNFDNAITVAKGPTNFATFDSVAHARLPANLPSGVNYKFRFRYQDIPAASNELGPITINALPAATLTNNGPLTCANTSVTLTARGGANEATYMFSTGTSQLADMGWAMTSVNQAGPYSVTITNPGGCSSSAITHVTSNTTSPASNLTNTGPVSANNPVILLGSQLGSTYAFSRGAIQPGGPTSNTATVTSPGFYSVTVTGANGCSTTASITVTGALSQTTCPSDTVVLHVVTTGKPITYEWYRNTTNSAPLTELALRQWGTRTSSLTLINQQATGDYYVRVTDETGSSIMYGPIRVTVSSACKGYVDIGSQPIGLHIVVWRNPVVGEQLQATIEGAADKVLTIRLLDMSGRVIRYQQWPQAVANQRIEWNLSAIAGGTYLLQAITEADGVSPAQRQSLKLIKL